MRKPDPPANGSPEAVDLRRAAIRFTRHEVSTTDADDKEGQANNRALLLAAVKYAARAGAKP